jgi:hypothetical protein
MKPLIICALIIALLAVTVLTAPSDTTNNLPLLAPGVTNLFSTNAQAALKPQVYHAAPYSCIVVVPKSVDTAALISPPSSNHYSIRTIEPQLPLRLEPMK